MYGKPIIGLAGGIGSGKSKIAAMLERLGCVVIDSDALSHAALRDPAVVAKLTQRWGPGILTSDGTPDRAKIGKITFGDRNELDFLTSIIHPKVAQLRADQLQKLKTDQAAKAVVLDSPLLFETHLDKSCDAVIFVKADEAVRMQRLQKSRRWTEEQLKKREKQQISLDRKEKMADYVVQNNGDLSSAQGQINQILAQILQTYASSNT